MPNTDSFVSFLLSRPERWCDVSVTSGPLSEHYPLIEATNTDSGRMKIYIVPTYAEIDKSKLLLPCAIAFYAGGDPEDEEMVMELKETRGKKRSDDDDWVVIMMEFVDMEKLFAADDADGGSSSDP